MVQPLCIELTDLTVARLTPILTLAGDICPRVPEITRGTDFTLEASRVVETFHALSCGHVAYRSVGRIHVTVTFTRGAAPTVDLHRGGE